MRQIQMLVALLVTVAGLAPPVAAQDRTQQCAVTAETPRRITESAGPVSGTATLPPEGHLWVLARMKGLARWYPQGEGPAVVQGGSWTVHVTYGEPGQLGTFEVAVVVVGSRSDQILRTWVDQSRPPYTPIPLPNTLPQCPMHMLEVQKVSG